MMSTLLLYVRSFFVYNGFGVFIPDNNNVFNIR